MQQIKVFLEAHLGRLMNVGLQGVRRPSRNLDLKQRVRELEIDQG